MDFNILVHFKHSRCGKTNQTETDGEGDANGEKRSVMTKALTDERMKLKQATLPTTLKQILRSKIFPMNDLIQVNRLKLSTEPQT